MDRFLRRCWRDLTTNSAHTGIAAEEPVLAGRTYAVPFEQVWLTAYEIVDGGLKRWRIIDADDEEGVIKAEAETRLFDGLDEIRLHVSLDENAQTRVDLASASTTGRPDLGRNRRRIKRFLRELDQRLTDQRGGVPPRQPAFATEPEIDIAT